MWPTRLKWSTVSSARASLLLKASDFQHAVGNWQISILRGSRCRDTFLLHSIDQLHLQSNLSSFSLNCRSHCIYFKLQLQLLLLLLTALWPYYLASSQLFSGKFSTGKDSQVHYNIFWARVSGSVVEIFVVLLNFFQIFLFPLCSPLIPT